jgi:ADP-heptose:LPS heptosyltransferase
LINKIKSDGRAVILVGASNDEGRFENAIDLRGKLTLPQLACLIKKTGLFIGLDSGPANIAAALNVRSVIICSGTNIPQQWIPNNSNVRFIFKDTACKPCGLKVCTKNKHECMEQISVNDVFHFLGQSPSTSKRSLGQTPSAR